METKDKKIIIKLMVLKSNKGIKIKIPSYFILIESNENKKR
jgi:hypothetical protein